MRTIAFVIILSTTTLFGAAPESVANDSAQATTTIFVVRHAEKIAGPGDPTLNEAGRKRADDLATLLKSAKVSACYCTQFQRTKLTAQPTAKAAGISVETHPAGDEVGLVKKILSQHAGKRVLIAAHSTTVPAILRHLGYENDLKLEEEDFDNLFIVQARPTSPPEVLHLHYGKSDTPPRKF